MKTELKIVKVEIEDINSLEDAVTPGSLGVICGGACGGVACGLGCSGL